MAVCGDVLFLVAVYTNTDFFLKPHIFETALGWGKKCVLRKAVFKKNPVHTNTLETNLCLAWCLLPEAEEEEELLKHAMFKEAVAC